MEGTDFLQSFSEIELSSTKRKVCERCRRPVTVCLCSYLSADRIQLQNTNLCILQHPNEVNRPLHTVALLQAALTETSITIYKGRRFGKVACPGIHEVLEQENTFLIYPGENAKPLEDLVALKPGTFNLFVLDGTWKQASSIYVQNEFLHALPKVQITPDRVSEYVVRTQPTDNSLSTVECVAMALEITESDPDLKEILLKPLRGLCKFQLDRGATIHHSKESIHNGVVTLD